MTTELAELSMEIEKIKTRLVHASVKDEGLSGGEVLKISQELDMLIVTYQRMMLQDCKK